MRLLFYRCCMLPHRGFTAIIVVHACTTNVVCVNFCSTNTVDSTHEWLYIQAGLFWRHSVCLPYICRVQ